MGWLSTHIATFFTTVFIAVGAFFGFHVSLSQLSPAPTSTASVVTSILNPGPAPTTQKVTSLSTPHINSISPAQGLVGTTVTLAGSGFTSNNVIFFGSGAISSVASTNKTTLSFTIPSSVGPYCAPGMACPMYMLLITPRAYAIHVQNANGSSNAVSFTVTGTSSLPPTTPGYQTLSVPGTSTLSKNGSVLVEDHALVLGYVTLEGTSLSANGTYQANLSVAPNAPSAACSAAGSICNLPMELAISIPQGMTQTADGMKITASVVSSGNTTLVFASAQ